MGRRDWELVDGDRPRLPADGLVWHPVPFEDRVDLALAATDLVVCRAGASTVAEVTATPMNEYRPIVKGRPNAWPSTWSRCE